MKNAPIKSIELDSNGHLQIFPDVSVSGNFQFIWRDASGVDWNEKSQALVAREPDRWEPDGLLRQIICAAINEYGIKLEITGATEWSNISDELKTVLKKAAHDAYTLFENLN